MALITYDSSIFISRKAGFPKSGFMLSVVVVQEMTAGAVDQTELKFWRDAYQAYEKDERLMVPDAEDWYQAGRILNSLLRGLKSASRGLTPRIHPDDKQRIVRDVLIARTARHAGVTVITDNIKDFESIQRFCQVRYISGKDYFGNR
jgi:hypothetical protein